MYKDKDKQREANKRAKAKQRLRDSEPAVARRYDDYGMTSQGMTVSGNDTPVIPRRGKDITKFEHLSPDVQATINRLSSDEQEHARRTAIAISYQHQFPDRYYSTGLR